MSAGRHISLVFRRELLDFRRERRVLVRLVLQPLVFILLLAAPATFIQRAEARSRATTFTVAVQGDIDAIPGLDEALARRPFRSLRTERAAELVVGERAEIALRVPDDAARMVARGETVPLQVLRFSTQNVSERAGPALTERLAQVGRAESRRLVALAGAPENLASPLRIVTEDVATTSAEGVRFGVAQALPALLVIQLFGLVAIAQERIAGAKDRRVLESVLVLPVKRPDLLIGMGAAAMVVGAFSSVVIFVPVTVGLSSVVAVVSNSMAGPGAIVVALGVGAVCLALTFTATGLLLGARAGSGSEGSVFVTVLQVAVFATVILLPFLAEVDARPPLLAIPVLGPMLFVRDGVASGTSGAAVATMVLAQLAIAMAILRLAARTLDGDRNVLRAHRS